MYIDYLLKRTNFRDNDGSWYEIYIMKKQHFHLIKNHLGVVSFLIRDNY